MSLQLFKIAELRGCWGSVAWTVGQKGSTRVLFCNSFLWYRSAIVQVAVWRQYGAVWARFVLVTSVLPFFRFSTLLARLSKRTLLDRS